ARTFACAVIDRLSRRYPRIMIHLRTGPVQDPYRKLTYRHFDLLITRRFGPIDDRFEFESPFDDSPFLVAAGARSPWARRRRIELAELVDEPWVLAPPDAGMGPLVVEAF